MSVYDTKILKRYRWIDIAKGIGVFLVVLSHMPSVPWIVRGWIESFHMPLFFFISGYVFTDKGESILEFAKRRLRTLIIPFLIYSILFLVTDILMGVKSLTLISSEIYKILIGIGTVDILWFFVALYFAELLFFVIKRICKKSSYLTVSSLMCFGIGWILAQFLPGEIPFKIPTTIIAISYYGVGYICKDMQLLIWNWKKMVIFCVISIGSSMFGVIRYGFVLNMYYGIYSNPILVLIASISGIIFLLLFCQSIESWLICRPLAYIGKNTLYFYPLMGYLPGLVVKICENIGICQGELVKIISKVLALLGCVLIVEIKKIYVKKYKQ